MSAAKDRRRSVALWAVLIALPVLSVSAALLVYLRTSAAIEPVTPPPPIANTSPVSQDHVLEGTPAPNFELSRLDGEALVRLSSFRGRVVFLNFWGTWCEPCKRELPALQAFIQQYNEANSPVVLAVNVGEPAQQVSDYLVSLGIESLPVLMDSDMAVSQAYQTEFYPSTFIINPAGVIAEFHLGEITLEQLTQYMVEHGSS